MIITLDYKNMHIIGIWKTDRTLLILTVLVRTPLLHHMHIAHATREARAVAALAEEKKKAKYLYLAQTH